MKIWELVGIAICSLGLLAAMDWERMLPLLGVELTSVVLLLILLALVFEQLSNKKSSRLQRRFFWTEGWSSGLLLSLILLPQLWLPGATAAQAAAQSEDLLQFFAGEGNWAWQHWQSQWQPFLFALFYQLCLLRILYSTFRSYRCLRSVLYCGMHVAGWSGIVLLCRLSGVGAYGWEQLFQPEFGVDPVPFLSKGLGGYFTQAVSLPLEILLLPLFSAGNCIAAFSYLRQALALQTERQYSQSLNHSVSDLAQSNIQVLDQALLHSSEIRRRERLEVAREIHDILGFTLSARLMHTEVLLQELQEESNWGSQLQYKLTTLLQSQQTQIREAIGQVRLAVSKLRSAGECKRFVRDWELLMDIFSKATRIMVIRHIPSSFAKLKNPGIGKLIYRLIQESLTNALRHGQASIVDIAMLKEEKLILMRISDNGIGCELLQIGNGLSGMIERLELLGGKLAWQTEVGKGFDLGIEIPYSVNDFLPSLYSEQFEETAPDEFAEDCR